MSLIRRAAAQLAERRGADPRLPWGDSTPPPPSLAAANAAGIPVTQGAAEGIAAVYGCCSLIADSVSSLPIELRDGPTRRGSGTLPLSPLLRQPYAEVSRRDWWVGFIWALALRGNYYGRVIQRSPAGLPVQIKPIHNDAVQVWRDKATGEVLYRYYGELIPGRDVFHVRYQSTPGNVIGLNPIQAMALSFGNALAKERFIESFYLNSANPMGVIQVPGYLDRTETRKMVRAWMAAHQGLNNANLPAILTEGAEFKAITISPNDAQLIEAMGFSEQQICGRIFRVPPHMIGIVDKATSWGKGIEQQERGFVTNTLVGYLTIGMEALTALHPGGQFVHFDTTQRERGATLERAQASALLMNSGVGIADDLREWFDWAPLPAGNGQESFMPINSQLLEAALLALKQAKEMPPPSSVPPAPAPPGARPPTTTGGSQRPPANVPTRPAATNGNGNGNGNGKRMSVEQAWFIVEAAVSQARRMQAAADLSTRLGQDED